ncbi:MAG: PorV/PorQ family protein [Candidatus Krumholzibacteria bacterium]|nr:PorV/PorQ family protein [Candidatus Krumholzibacteria bacterium]
MVNLLQIFLRRWTARSAWQSVLVVLLLSTGFSTMMAAPSRAAEFIRLFGEENVGTAGAQFLRVPVGARAVAMGKAYSALASDGATLFWNPAGIMRTPGRKNFFFSHTEYTAGIAMEHLSYHQRGQNFGYGLSAGVLRSGDILRTDELHQEGTGQFFNANQFYLGASVARAMTDRFSIGGTVKYFQENLDEYQTKAIFADLGILYFVGLGDTRIGFSVRNFGNDMQPVGTPAALSDGYVAANDFQSFAAPTVGQFGAARTWQLSQKMGFLTSVDFAHPSDYKESFRMGGELSLNKILFLRVGYETSRAEGGFATGFGVELKRKQMLLKVDYAYSDLGSFGTIHHISIDLSPLARRKDPDAWRRSGR